MDSSLKLTAYRSCQKITKQKNNFFYLDSISEILIFPKPSTNNSYCEFSALIRIFTCSTYFKNLPKKLESLSFTKSIDEVQYFPDQSSCHEP